MPANRFERRKGEGLAEYVARLEKMEGEGLPEAELHLWADSLTAAKIARDLGRKARAALERVKAAVRQLSAEDRQQLADWLAGGMKD